MRCHATKANSGIGFVLCNLYAQECRAIHSAKNLERAILITNSDTHRNPHLLSLSFGGFNDTFCCFAGDTGFLEAVSCHRNVLSSCRVTTLSVALRWMSRSGLCFLTRTLREGFTRFSLTDSLYLSSVSVSIHE